MGTQPLPKKGAEPASSIFGPFLLWPNGWMHQDATWYGGRPQPRGLCVRWGPSHPSQKGGIAPPQFSAHVCCGQMVAWIKMSLGMEVGQAILGESWTPISGHIVLDKDPAPLPNQGAQPPIFGQCLLRPNGCMDQDATWYGGRPRPSRHCVRWRPSSSLPKKGGAPSPIFGQCLLWPNGWMDQDGTWHGGGSS